LSSGPYALFDLNLTSGVYNVKVSNSDIYNQPPKSDTSTPWKEFVKGFADIFKGIVKFEEEPIRASADIIMGTDDLINGAVDMMPSDNQNTQTYNILQSTFTGTKNNTQQLQPTTGAYCGGDVFTLSDGDTTVFELATAKSSSSPPEVQLYIMPWNIYWARNAAVRMNVFRTGSDGQTIQTGVPSTCFYSIVFANPSDTDDPSFCSSYWSAASKNFDANQIIDWTNFVNYLPTLQDGKAANGHSNSSYYLNLFGAWCGTPDLTCFQ